MKKDYFDYIWTDKKRTLFGLPLSFTRYFLTDTKFITRTGFLSVEEDELELYKVTDKKLVIPLGQRIFGCSTIVLNVKNDVDTPVKEIKSIKNAREVLSLIDKQIDVNRDKYNIRGRDMYGDAHHFSSDFDGGFDDFN
ncbi:MAG: PH domain-containing protein [Ruminococcus sp.]|nr:PH domain-containing protein [Ruminococcus sp.]